MKLQFLGTGAAEGIPAFLCNCAICTTARRRRGRELRQNSCALVTASTGATLLLDVPPHIKMAADLYAVDPRRLSAILITHAHSDHCLGLEYLPCRAVSGNGYREPSVVELCVPSSVLPFAERIAGEPLTAAEGESPFRLRIARACEGFAAGPFAVTPLETGHVQGGECLGYLIEEQGRTLAYILDSPPRLPERSLEQLLARRIDCLVWDCTFDGRSDPGSHSNPAAVIAMHELLKPRVTLASHVSHRCHDYRALRRLLARRGIRAAYDGMVVTVPQA